MSQTIYVVTAGSYSDYGIVGVYTDKDLAETCAQIIDEGRVEEYEINPEADRLRQGLKHFRVSMEKNGDKARAWPSSSLRDTYESFSRDYSSCYVWAHDETQAIKAANERRLRAIATAPATA